MGTEEKLYKKIQQAAENATQKDFPGMEKIWARVEDKMETQTLQKEKHLWKKLAVAASVVLVGTLTFFLLQEKENVIVPENTITTIDSSKNNIPTLESANGLVNTNPEIKKAKRLIIALGSTRHRSGKYLGSRCNCCLTLVVAIFSFFLIK